MLGFAGLPPRLIAFLLSVIVAGPVVALTMALINAGQAERQNVVASALLVALAAVANRFQHHLTHKTQVSVSSAAELALILVVPWGWPALLALCGAAIGQVSQSRTKRDPLEGAFNAAQTGLCVAASTGIYLTFKDLPLGPQVGSFGALGGLIIVALFLHAVNGLLIAIAAGLHLGTNPLRIWIVTLTDDLIAHMMLCGLGLAGAYLALVEPIILPLLALPAWAVRRSTTQTVRLREDTYAALAALVDVLEVRDPYTAGHSRRVGELARKVALSYGLTNEEADQIEAAGQVHDVGKIGIEPAVISKPGKLTDAEYAEMKRHPVLSEEIVGQFDSYRTGLPIIRHHHERWDGQGYPDGLAYTTIPLGARILAVADTYDALTSARPYRAAIPEERSLSILRDGAGSQWDPTVVQALLAILEQPKPVIELAPFQPVAAVA